MRVPQTAGRPANIINHIVFVVDESSSMGGLAATVVRVFNNNIAYLAAQSRANGQETRVTVYFFNSNGTAWCVIYDMDVLRTPTIDGLYRPRGMTALIDTTMLAIEDARLIPQKYGDHSFLFLILTDGANNDSRYSSFDLTRAIDTAPENETYGVFVPDQRGVHEAKRHGFPAANISVWDATSVRGMEEVGRVMRDVSDAFMEGRAQGVRGWNAKTGRSGSSLFKVREFSAAEVTSSLPSLTQGSYFFLDVNEDSRIDEFVRGNTGSYRIGSAYYQHTKSETIQPQKEIAVEVVEHEGTANEVRRVYTGRAARNVLGLPDTHVKVKPNEKNGCTVFVQSTSPNRKLVGGTRLLVMR